MTTRAAIATLAAVGLLGAGGVVAWDAAHPPQTRTIRPSYAFDVTDPELLAGYSDVVALVTVTDGGESVTVGEEVYTDYRVTIQQALKGDVSGVVEVRQTGGKNGEDTFVLEDQPLLVQGQSYVLVLGAEPDRTEMTVVAGPISAKPLPPGQTKRNNVLQAWRSAVARQRNPNL